MVKLLHRVGKGGGRARAGPALLPGLPVGGGGRETRTGPPGVAWAGRGREQAEGRAGSGLATGPTESCGIRMLPLSVTGLFARRSTGARAAVWRAAQGPLFGPSDLAVGGLSCAPPGARVWPSGFRGAGGSRVARQGPARHRGPPCTSPAGSGASQTRIGGRAPVPAAMRPPPSRDRALRRHVTQRLVRTAARCGQRCWRLCRRQRRARRSPAEARAAVLTA